MASWEIRWTNNKPQFCWGSHISFGRDIETPPSSSGVTEEHYSPRRKLFPPLIAYYIEFTGNSDGRICLCDTSTGTASTVDRTPHLNYVSGLVSSQGRIFSVGWDDTLRTIDVSANTLTGTSIKTDGQPRGVVATSTSVIAATHKGITMLSQTDNSIIKNLPTPSFAPTAVAVNDTHIAVAGDDNAQHMYLTSLHPFKTIPHPTAIIGPARRTICTRC